MYASKNYRSVHHCRSLDVFFAQITLRLSILILIELIIIQECNIFVQRNSLFEMTKFTCYSPPLDYLTCSDVFDYQNQVPFGWNVSLTIIMVSCILYYEVKLSETRCFFRMRGKWKGGDGVGCLGTNLLLIYYKNCIHSFSQCDEKEQEDKRLIRAQDGTHFMWSRWLCLAAHSGL